MAAIQAFLDRNGISQAELGDALGITSGAISRKLGGSRAWKLQDVQRVLAWLSERLSRPVSFDEVFASDDLGDDVPASSDSAA